MLNFRAPEDGFYTFTLAVRENGNVYAGGTIQRISASDPNDISMLCAAEVGNDGWQTGSCTVSTNFMQNSSFKMTFDLDIKFKAIEGQDLSLCPKNRVKGQSAHAGECKQRPLLNAIISFISLLHILKNNKCCLSHTSLCGGRGRGGQCKSENRVHSKRAPLRTHE